MDLYLVDNIKKKEKKEEKDMTILHQFVALLMFWLPCCYCSTCLDFVVMEKVKIINVTAGQTVNIINAIKSCQNLTEPLTAELICKSCLWKSLVLDGNQLTVNHSRLNFTFVSVVNGISNFNVSWLVSKLFLLESDTIELKLFDLNRLVFKTTIAEIKVSQKIIKVYIMLNGFK